MLANAGRLVATIAGVMLLGESGALTQAPETAAAARFRTLSPKSSMTLLPTEMKMRDVVTSLPPSSLAAFKFDLEYDGDYKDMVEYVFHDIDNGELQTSIVKALRQAPPHDGVKVLTDVDDTMLANLVDKRYRKAPYPGVIAFYNALKQEPAFPSLKPSDTDKLAHVPITTLSARPNPIAGKLEEQSLEKVAEYTDSFGSPALKLKPSGLSGQLTSSALGTLQTIVRDRFSLRKWFPNLRFQNDPLAGEQLIDCLNDKAHGQEDEIGRVKHSNFLAFANVYPDYRFVFVGDSGQADALTARLILETGEEPEGPRVITTFIHDLKDELNRSAKHSVTFDKLPDARRVSRRTEPGRGRGVIQFRNYIEAALIAYIQRESLNNLITADELTAITLSALSSFPKVVEESAKDSLRREYRDDAAAAADLLGSPVGGVDLAAKIRRVLADRFWSTP